MCLSQLTTTTTLPLAQVQAHTFELDEDTTSYGDYVKGGIVTEHKEHKTLDFKPLAQALEDPGEFLLSDFAKMERPGILHLGFQALNEFQVCGSCFTFKSDLSAILEAGSRHVHLFCTCPPVKSSSNVTAESYHLQHLDSLTTSTGSLSTSTGSLLISIDSLSKSRDIQSALCFQRGAQSTSDRHRLCCVMQDENGRRPHAYNREDAASLVQIAHKINVQASNKVDVDEVQLPLANLLLCMHRSFH